MIAGTVWKKTNAPCLHVHPITELAQLDPAETFIIGMTQQASAVIVQSRREALSGSMNVVHTPMSDKIMEVAMMTLLICLPSFAVPLQLTTDYLTT